MPKLKTTRWSLDTDLKTERDMQAYLDAVIEENDPLLLADALGVIARKKGMSKVARKAGLSRENLYTALSVKGNPEIATVMKVLAALGLSLRIVPASN